MAELAPGDGEEYKCRLEKDDSGDFCIYHNAQAGSTELDESQMSLVTNVHLHRIIKS